MGFLALFFLHGLIAWLVLVPIGWIAVGVVLALSALLALTGICVGCELYLAGQRLVRARGQAA